MFTNIYTFKHKPGLWPTCSLVDFHHMLDMLVCTSIVSTSGSRALPVSKHRLVRHSVALLDNQGQILHLLLAYCWLTPPSCSLLLLVMPRFVELRPQCFRNSSPLETSILTMKDMVIRNHRRLCSQLSTTVTRSSPRPGGSLQGPCPRVARCGVSRGCLTSFEKAGRWRGALSLLQLAEEWRLGPGALVGPKGLVKIRCRSL